MTGLSANTEYTIRVAAATSKGAGPIRSVTQSTRPPPGKKTIPDSSNSAVKPGFH